MHTIKNRVEVERMPKEDQSMRGRVAMQLTALLVFFTELILDVLPFLFASKEKGKKKEHSKRLNHTKSFKTH